MANRRIDYTIGFKVNKSELNAIYNSFREIKNLTPESYQLKFGVSGNLREVEKELDTIQKQVDVIETSYKNSFDSKLGILNLQSFNSQLSKGGVNSTQLFQTLSKIGKEDVFANIVKGATTANLNLKQTTSFLDKMGETLTSTVRWGISSRLMNSFVGSVKGSFSYIKELDTSLNDIRIVTGKSADEMATFAREANRAASALGSTTKTYTDASLIYFQQGLSDKEVRARAETTLKAANVTGQSGEEVSEQLTAVWNGYKVSAAETELYVDKLAAVAATTASNLEELSTGMSKVASAASIMGVDIDQLNGMLSTAISVTRQAPESVGTAFKTIFARIGDIEAGEGEVSLGEYTSKMKEIGFNVLDANNKLRNQGDVIEEIGNRWNTLSREQQIALAQTMAGARQYNNLLALFDNWDMYTKAIETSRDATGTLQKQQDVYMESTEAHLQRLTTAQEQFQASLLDSKSINEVSDALTSMFNILSKGVDALGGGAGTLLNFGSILTRIFSKQIAKNITPIVKNIKDLKYNAKSLDMIMSNIKNLENYNDYGSKTAVPRLREQASRVQPYLKNLNVEEQQKILDLMAEKVTADSKVEAIQNRKAETIQWLNKIIQSRAFQGQKVEKVNDTDSLNSKKVQDILESRQTAFNRYKDSFVEAEQALKRAMKSGESDIVVQKDAISDLLNQVQVMKLEFNNLEGLELYSEQQELTEISRIKAIEEAALKAQAAVDKALEDRENNTEKSQQEQEDEEQKKAAKRAKDRETERRRKLTVNEDKKERVNKRIEDEGWERNATFGKGNRTYTRKKDGKEERKTLYDFHKEEQEKIEQEKKALQNPLITTVDFKADAESANKVVQQSNEANEKIKSYSANFSEKSQAFLNAHMQKMTELASQVNEIGNADSEGLENQEKAIQAFIENAQNELNNFSNNDETLEIYKEEEAEAEKDRIREVIKMAEEALQKIKDAEAYNNQVKNKKDEKEEAAKRKAAKDASDSVNKRVDSITKRLVKITGSPEDDPEYEDSKTGKRFKKSRIQQYALDNYNKENNTNFDLSQLLENSININEQLENMGGHFSTINETLEEVGDTAAKAEENIKGAEDGAKEASAQSDSAGQDINDMLDDAKIQATVDSVVQLTSNLGMSFSIMNNIAELPNIWQSQEDWTTKAAQTFFNFAQTAIPAVVSGINTIQTATTALQASLGIIGIIGMAIGAVIGVAQAVINWQKNEREARAKNRREIIKENEARQAEIEENTKLYQSYKKTEEQYKNHEISKQDMLSATEDLINAYDIENGKLIALKGNYELLARSIRDAEIASLEESKSTTETTKGLAMGNIQDLFSRNDTSIFSMVDSVYGNATVATHGAVGGLGWITLALGAINQATGGALGKDQRYNIDDNGNLNIQEYIGGASMFTDAKKPILEENFDITDTESIQDYILQHQNDSKYSNVVKYLKDLIESEDYGSYTAAIEQNRASSFNAGYIKNGLEDATNYEDYSQKLDALQKELQFTDEQFNQYLKQIDSTFAQKYVILEDIKDRIGYIEKLDLSQFESSPAFGIFDAIEEDKQAKQEAKQEIIDFLNTLSEEDLAIAATIGINTSSSVESIKLGIEAAKTQLNPEDLTIYATIRTKIGTDDIGQAIDENLIQYGNGFLEDIEERSSFRQIDALNQAENLDIANNENYIASMLDEKTRTDKQKEYTDRIGAIEENDLYKNYQAITTDKNVNFQDLKSLQKFSEGKDGAFLADKLEQIKEFYDETGQLKAGYTEERIMEEIFGETSLENAKQMVSEVKNLTDASKALAEIDFKTYDEVIFNKISAQTDQILSSFDAIKDAGSLIGEGFVVAADDLEEFASKFPELLKDYEVLSDGSIKLSQEQVEATIGGIHEEQKAKTEAQIEELDQQIALSELKIKFLEDQREQSLALLRGEISNEQYITNMKNIGADYESKISDLLAENEVENFDTVLEAQTSTVKDEIDNINILGEAYSKLAVHASAALAGKDPGEWTDVAVDALASQTDTVTQEFLDSINSKLDLSNLKDVTQEQLNNALKLLNTTNEELEKERTKLDYYKQQKVLLESGLNASLDSIDDSLAEQIDLLKDILDIYHDINNELTQIDTLLGKVTEEQNRLTGQDYVNSLNDENKLLDAQIEKLKKKKTIGMTEAAGLKDQLTGFGFIFNEDGTVANYEQAMMANAQIVQDAQMSGDEDAAERAQEKYDQMKEALERYEEITLNELPGYDEEIRDTFNKQIENNIKKFNYELDLHVNLNTLQKDFNTFQQNMLDENDLAGKFNLQADYLFDSNAMSNITEQTNHVKDIMSEIQKMENGQESEIFGDNIAAAYEELEKSTKDLQNSTLEVKQAFDEALNTYLSMMTQLSDAMDTQQELYDKANSILEHRKNVISMVFGEDSYKEFDMYYQKQHENNLEAIDAARASRDYWAEVMANEEEGSEIWLQAKDNWLSATETLNSKVEDSISNLKAKYDNAIKLIFQNTNNQITNGKGLDYLKYEWDYIKEDSAQYLDNVDRAYQVSKFSANIEKQINSSSSVNAKKRLADFQQQELEMLENKDKLSQYDLDRSNKKLEILQAQIALEDAQNNKSSMRLRRDSQGNYSYQFVADTSAVEKAQEDLQNSVHDLYTLDKERLQTTVDEYYNTWMKAQEEIATAMQTLQGEELEARIQQIKDHYQPLLAGYSLDITEANNNLSQSALSNLSLFNKDAKISTDDIVNYLTGDKTGSKKLENEFIASLNNVGINFKESLPGMSHAGLLAVATDVGTTQTALDSMFDQVLQEAKQFQTQLGEIENASGESFKDYTTNAGKAYEQTKKLVDYQGKLITQYQNKLGISRETLTKLEELSGKFSNIATNATNAAKAALKLFNQKYTAKIDVTGFTDAIDALIEKLGEYTDKVGEITGYTGLPSSGGGGSDNNNSKNKKTVAFQTNMFTYGSELNSAGTQWNSDKDNMNLITAGATYLDLNKKYTGYKNEQDYYNLLDAEGNVLTRMHLKETTRKGTAAIRVNPLAGDTRTIDVPKGTKILYDPSIRETANGGGYYQIWYKNDNGAYATGYVGKQVFASLDTGGYTGVWNSKQGKMAMLHEKELVLNAKDTANILSAVQLMRKQQDLVNALSLSAIAQKQAMLDRINATMIPDIATAANTLDQNVHIEASFPNVRDSRQIEEAFDNLVNMASQYANRKLL